MITILIVEDNDYKLTSIRKLLEDDLMIPGEFIDAVKDIKSAKKLLISKTFDLLILDLVLPLEIGDDPSPVKGIGFLKDLNTNPRLFSPIHIIGITQFGDLQKEYSKDFEDELWHLINYNPTEDGWQRKLKSKVNHLLDTKRRFVDSMHSVDAFDIAIITALNKPEFEKILELPFDWKEFSLEADPTRYYKGIIHRGDKSLKIVTACVGQMGMTPTSVLATKMVHRFVPRYIIMGGICAGLKERGLNYGDIIIAEQSWDYGSGKLKEVKKESSDSLYTIFEPDPRHLQLFPLLKSKINSFLMRKDILSKIQNECKYPKPDQILKAEIGPVASGSYVLSSISKINEIKEHQRKVLGIEMEGYGLYYACDQSPNQATKAMMIKSVSDFADSSKNDLYQDYGSYTSAQFIYHFILEELLLR